MKQCAGCYYDYNARCDAVHDRVYEAETGKRPRCYRARVRCANDKGFRACLREFPAQRNKRFCSGGCRKRFHYRKLTPMRGFAALAGVLMSAKWSEEGVPGAEIERRFKDAGLRF